VGIDKATLERVFEPFFTTKPMGQGTGLGLSMVYGFARQSNGHVRIYSEVGKGTMVCIYLPRYHGDEDVEPVLASTPEPLRTSDAVVLVIDDEPTVRMMITDALGDLNYNCIEATDGPGGLEVVRSGKRIDLLITDVGLPGGLNGRQVADAAQALRPGLKVLFRMPRSITGTSAGHGGADEAVCDLGARAARRAHARAQLALDHDFGRREHAVAVDIQLLEHSLRAGGVFPKRQHAVAIGVEAADLVRVRLGMVRPHDAFRAVARTDLCNADLAVLVRVHHFEALACGRGMLRRRDSAIARAFRFLRRDLWALTAWRAVVSGGGKRQSAGNEESEGGDSEASDGGSVHRESLLDRFSVPH
jgi:hypothetical protein